MKVTIADASLFELVGFAGGHGITAWRVLKQMWMTGQVFAFRRDAAIVGIAALVPIGEDAEAYFDFLPGAAPALPWIARLCRLTLDRQTYRRIIVLCVSEHGQRFAAATGFVRLATHDRGELWAR